MYGASSYGEAASAGDYDSYGRQAYQGPSYDTQAYQGPSSYDEQAYTAPASKSTYGVYGR